MQIYTIEDVIIQTEKNGKPLINKNGEPYKMMYLKLAELPDKMPSMYLSEKFPNKQALELKAGVRVELIIEENGSFLNFKIPTRTDRLEIKVNDHEMRLRALEGTNPQAVPQNAPQGVQERPEAPVKTESVPF